MNIFKIKGEEYPFYSYTSNTDIYLDEAISFFDKDNFYVVAINTHEHATNTIFEKLRKAIRDEFYAQYEMGVTSFYIDLDDIVKWFLSDETLPYNLVLEIFSNHNERKTVSNSLYNTYVSYNGSLYFVTHLKTGEKESEFYCGEQLILKVATDIERFPSMVSYNIIQRQLDILTKKKAIGVKFLELENILTKGLHVTYIKTI